MPSCNMFMRLTRCYLHVLYLKVQPTSHPLLPVHLLIILFNQHVMALTRKLWSSALILYFLLQNYTVDENNISEECGKIPGCWKSLFQRHLATYNYGESDFS